MNTPLVSIIIPVYNGADFLADAIESALAQNYQNLEIVVINDGSTDAGATEKLTHSYGNKIRYIHKENGGVATALNTGIQEAKGEYISWLSHDDVYTPEKITESMKLLQSSKNNGKTIVFTNYCLIDIEKNIIKEIQAPQTEEDMFFRLISNTFALNGCSLLIPKKAFEVTGLFDKELKTTQDYNMWIRMLAAGYIFQNLNKAHTHYRIHGNQDSIKKKSLHCKEIREAQKEILNIFSLQDLQKRSGNTGNTFIFFLHLQFIYIKQNFLGYAAIASQKLGIYGFLAPLWRKYVLRSQ